MLILSFPVFYPWKVIFVKRIIPALLSIALLFITTVTAEEIDLYNMTYNELLQLQQQVNTALWNSDGWNEVTVPPGVYEVGKDIPAGRYTVRPWIDKPVYYYYFYVFESFEDAIDERSFEWTFRQEMNDVTWD